MTNRRLFLLACSAAGCMKPRPDLPAWPAQLGPWRCSTRAPGNEEPPSPAPTPTRAEGLQFDQPGQTIQAVVYRFPSKTVAFEAQQKWQNRPGMVTFYHEDFFVILWSKDVPTPGLIAFSNFLDANWPGAPAK